MRKLLIALTVVIALCVTTNSALADLGDDVATADVNCTVTDIAEWALPGDYNEIQLPDITDQNSYTADANALLKLYTNANVTMTADTTTASRLDKIDDVNEVLVTEYKLTYDANGTTGTGGDTSAKVWETYNEFAPVNVTHVSGDGEVEVRLHVRARNTTGELADAGKYTAKQTLTIAF